MRWFSRNDVSPLCARSKAAPIPLAVGSALRWTVKTPFDAIVGIAGDITDGPRGSRSRPTVYYVHAHLTFPSLIIVVRMAAAPESVSLPVQRVIRELDPGATVSEAATMEEVLGEPLGASDSARLCWRPSPVLRCC
jgi:hypothetical protein